MRISSTRDISGFLVILLVIMAPAAHAQTAHYNVTFDATWSPETHPVDYPPGPHFSGLVGGTHNASVSFWNTGELASLGIKRMAEWGSQAELLDEIQTAIDAGSAQSTLTDLPLWTVPGSTGFDFELSPEHSFVTLVAMIAPSPDWFVGVRNLDLAPGGFWTEELVVDLFAFDAGTDSGRTYTSPDQATVPPDPIAPITGYPFEVGVPLGTLTFTKLYVSDVPEVAVLRATVFPNPFNPQTTIAWELPASGSLNIEINDLAGRLVRRLYDGHAPAGPGRVTWNGRDESGLPAGSGLYFARVVTASEVLTKKITLAK